ncbi:lipid-binding SYLF domain-containing protein [Aquimarina sp. M1]
MKTLKSSTILMILFITFGVFSQNKKDQEIINDAQKAKQELLKKNSVLDRFFDDSAGYVIFPNVGKGGFIVGGASGNGAVFQNGTVVGMADLKKLNVGLQAGGQVITEIIFFESESALKEFKEGNFEFAAEASAVVLKSGAAVNAKYKDGIAVFAIPKKGLMVDASIGGQKFAYTSLK